MPSTDKARINSIGLDGSASHRRLRVLFTPNVFNNDRRFIQKSGKPQINEQQIFGYSNTQNTNKGRDNFTSRCRPIPQIVTTCLSDTALRGDTSHNCMNLYPTAHTEPHAGF